MSKGYSINVSEKQIKDFISNRVSSAEAAETLGCSSHTVRRRARAYGIRYPEFYRPKIKAPPRERLEEEIANHMTTRQIAEMFSCSQHTVCSWLKRYGIIAPRAYRGKPCKPRFCLFCGKQILIKMRKYCNRECMRSHKASEYLKLWKAGKIVSNGDLSDYIKRYLIETRGNKCEKCGWAERNPVTGRIPIETNHINGNPYDDREENLELLCPNHHALTPNYKSLNNGNGRKWRK